MTIQILKNDTYNDVQSLPKKGTDLATGYDVIATSEPEIVGQLETNSSTLYKRIDYIQYRTNLRIATVGLSYPIARFESGKTITRRMDYDVLAFPRSSISKYNLTLANSIGLIDADYRGEILLRFKYIWQPEDMIYVPTPDGNASGISAKLIGKPNLNRIYNKGDKICQLKVTKVEDVEFELVDELDTTQRGSGGFGSTDGLMSGSLSPESTNVHPNRTLLEDMYVRAGGIPTPDKKYSQLINERNQNQFS